MEIKRVRALLAILGATLFVACEPVMEPAVPGPEGVKFSYSGARTGSFASTGNVMLDEAGLPALETFAVAQRDTVEGLLLGSFRTSGGARGDLFILQIRGTEPLAYTCGAVTGGPACYGHLYLEVGTDHPTTAEQVYGISAGQVVLSEVGDTRMRGTFNLTLQHLEDPAKELSIENGTLDVPVVEGVFNSSFACLMLRLEKGADVPCE